ncbi:putative pq loop repeat protein [Neofusicoccum parvum UCRNP2]|uniref:Putative pq loop repeat protein n=1 Tax=Botryosphaeria parva (strain UCR-NP2) TaxID=1287680 RepID=R1EZD8_BOTPV|nr:putative pq loop repeat protein [Neofusicoccum parvum UCRNP2]
MDALSERCERLAHPDIGNFAISIFILVGILVSYLPQHAKIILRRSSEGLSPWFVLLGTTSGTCAIANILVLPRSRQDVDCCNEIDGFACGAALLGIAQVGVQWSCFFLMDRKEQKAQASDEQSRTNGASERTPLLPENGESPRE